VETVQLQLEIYLLSCYNWSKSIDFVKVRNDFKCTEFSWVKAHVGINGNELADQLAKAAPCNRDTTVSFNRFPKSALYGEIEEEATQKWQKEWGNCRKAVITKQFFPILRDRVKLNINVNPNFTAMVTGHGKTITYLHRFKITENTICPCNKGDQTIDHLLDQCTLLQTQRELLRNNVLKSGNWPVSKEELMHVCIYVCVCVSMNVCIYSCVCYKANEA
jgi:hypothetical protein